MPILHFTFWPTILKLQVILLSLIFLYSKNTVKNNNIDKTDLTIAQQRHFVSKPKQKMNNALAMTEAQQTFFLENGIFFAKYRCFPSTIVQ